MTHALTLNPRTGLSPSARIFASRPISIRINFSQRIFWILNFILIILLGLYIFQVGTLTQAIYLIKDYEKKLDSLSKENEILEINFSKSNSLSNIENFLSKENFVKSNKVKYIQILESSVLNK